MSKGWYARFVTASVVVVLGGLALWPSLNAWVATPAWVSAVFSQRISPGLDIQGGLRLMYEVEVEEAVLERRERLSEALTERLAVKLGIIDEQGSPSREDMAKVKERIRAKKVGDRRIEFTFSKAGDVRAVEHAMIRDEFTELREVERTENSVSFVLREDGLDELRKTAIDQTVRTISNRIDELQIRETTVIGRETDIIVEIPGADEAMFDRIRTIIGKTARLDFKVVDDEGSAAFFSALQLPEGVRLQGENQPGGVGKPSVAGAYLEAKGSEGKQALQALISSLEVPDDHEVLVGKMDGAEGEAEESWRTYYLYSMTSVTGEDVKDAFVTYDTQEGSKPYVAINFDSTGASRFEQLTERNTQRRMAIVLDDRVESAPVIQEKIGGGRARITMGAMGGFQQLIKEAEDLSIVLRAGALPAPIRPANEQLIGPTLGRDSVEKGAIGALVGVGIVLLFMLFYYQVAGVVADVMVLINVMMLLAILSGLGATLTLPGIAGIALTVGMAVDANVLITERIREELRAGKSPTSAVDQGFSRAVWSVLDSQITTFIAGVVLFQYGTGPIKGFAVTLMIGIATSLFTGMFCSKVMLDWIVRGLKVKRFAAG